MHKAVSYTHLDVYKRQVLYIEAISNTPAYEKAVADAFKKVQTTYPGIELKKNDKGWEVAVSYTHLDVYKRQALRHRGA